MADRQFYDLAQKAAETQKEGRKTPMESMRQTELLEAQ